MLNAQCVEPGVEHYAFRVGHSALGIGRYVSDTVDGMRVLWVPLMAALIVASCGGTAETPAREYQLQGQILAVRPERSEVVIKHQDIKGFMPGMTMPFKVKDDGLLKGKEPGDLVTATLVVGEVDAHLRTLDKTGHTALEAPDKTSAFVYAVTPHNMDQQDPDYPAMVLADRILGGDEKSRLWVRIREREGLSYGVNSNFRAGPQEKYGVFAAVASVKPENTAKVEAAFKEEIAKVINSGFAAEEVSSAKNALMQERQLSRSQDNQLVGLFVSQAELGRTMQREIDLEKRILETSPEQLAAAFKKWIDPATIAYFKAGDFKKAAAATAK